MSTTKKNKIEYGSVHIPSEKFLPQNTKIRISMWVSGDVLDAYKAAAEKRDIGYQTLMQEVLRDNIWLFGEGEKFVTERLLQRVKGLEEDLAEQKAILADLKGRTTTKKRRA